MTRAEVAELIRVAFSDTPPPARDNLRNSSQSDEPFLVEEAFAGETDWRTLTPEFLDAAPDGFGSALSFFSNAAFRFFLPAYLVADLEGRLECVDPSFHLCHGFDDETGQAQVNPTLYGQRTWGQHARQRFAGFTRAEAEAVVAYLRLKAAENVFREPVITKALRNFWLARCEAG